ncbi:MAG: response regulator, partial [Alphaproteobacteria bacterium]|nr:response regulator [Alphaproteobacteria bacterium]
MAHNTGPILLVEDCADDAEAATHAFKKAGLANPLAHAASAEQAFAYLQASARPCLILLDLNMPGMGGRKFLETLKQDAALKDIPVVIMTASDCEQDIKSCYAMGANAYIVKSSDLAGLATAIRRLKEHWLDTVALPAVFEDGGV